MSCSSPTGFDPSRILEISVEDGLATITNDAAEATVRVTVTNTGSLVVHFLVPCEAMEVLSDDGRTLFGVPSVPCLGIGTGRAQLSGFSQPMYVL